MIESQERKVYEQAMRQRSMERARKALEKVSAAVEAGRLKDPTKIGARAQRALWERAVRCGMLQADEVVFISDGGGWCDTVARTYFHDAERIPDWYHLVEHVWEAARGLYSDEQASKKWDHVARDCFVNRVESVCCVTWSGVAEAMHPNRAARRGLMPCMD